MRHFFLLLFTILCTCVSAQNVVAERTAELVPADYAVSGSAILRSYANGTIDLSLSEDFATDAGPDVRVYLSNGRTRNGGLALASLTQLRHWRGARTFAVPDTVDIAEYSHVVMFCVLANALWCSGEFSALPAESQCTQSTVTAISGDAMIDVCPGDGQSDIVQFQNNLATADTLSYAYLLTDENETLLGVLPSNSYDFESSGTETNRIYGIQYSGDLIPAIGANRRQTTATMCYEPSADDAFLTVTKQACNPAYDCMPSTVATHDWVTTIDLCTTDAEADRVFIQNNLGELSAEHYAYLLTDANEVVLEVIQDSTYSFAAGTTEERRIYGINFDGELMVQMGQVRTATTATGCFEHSLSDVFITVNPTAACATSVADRELAEQLVVAPNPATDRVNVSWPSDFQPDVVVLRDLTGRVVRAIVPEVSGLELSVDGLVGGTYFLQLRESDGGRFAVHRLVVVK